MRIDSHHHFWKYDPVEYDWIGPDMGKLQRDFLLADLEREAASADIGGVISVQARQSVEETAWLLELASGSGLIKGVVGWVPLISRRWKQTWNTLRANKNSKACGTFCKANRTTTTCCERISTVASVRWAHLAWCTIS